MTKEELLKIAEEKGVSPFGLMWIKNHEIEDLKSIEAIEKKYWNWVWENVPECRDQIRHDKPVLDELINHDEWVVRRVVARQGYGLNKLINNEHCYVRATVARQGYGLDKLVNDEDVDVRIAVAEQGYGLDKLVNDEDWDVRDAAIISLKYKKN